MRLIDADVLIKHYESVIKDYESDNCSSFVKDKGKIKLIANVFRDVLSRIKSQPTVYDVDKVVEEIMEVYGCHNCEQCDTMACNECAERKGYNKALDNFANACKEDIMCKTFGLRECDIEQIAEQLKVGGENGNI